jgi:hypothetical protein
MDLPPSKQQAIENMKNAAKQGSMDALKDLLVVLQSLFNQELKDRILEDIYFSKDVTLEQKQLIISRNPSITNIVKQRAKQSATLQMIRSAREGSFDALRDLLTLMKKSDKNTINWLGEILVEIFLSDKSTREQKAFLWANKDLTVQIIEIETTHEGWVHKDYSYAGHPEQSEDVWKTWTETETKYISLYEHIKPHLDSLK